MPHPMSSSINSRYVIVQKCNVLSIFIRITYQTLPYHILSTSWCEGIFSSHIQQSRMNEKSVSNSFHSSPSILLLSASPHFIHLVSLHYITPCSPCSLHLQLPQLHLLIFLSFCPSPLTSSLTSLVSILFNSTDIHWTLFVYSLRVRGIGYERTEQSEGWGEGEELITRIQVVRTVFVHRHLLLLG